MRYFFIILMMFSIHSAEAQFLGGNGDGYSIAQLQNSISIYLGGNKDGQDQALYANPTSISLGGNKDGFDQDIYTNPTSIIFLGGNEDGYDQQDYNNSTSISLGGNNDGQDQAIYDSPTTIFKGGNEDGYSSIDNLIIFEWTGAIGTGWNVTGNWLGGVIPTIDSRVVIPASVPNFPFVNAGIMSVGLDLNGGTFFARSVSIEPGAEMTLRLNTLLENYGTINIEGIMFILNNGLNAVQNLGGGLIDIYPNGVMRWQ